MPKTVSLRTNSCIQSKGYTRKRKSGEKPGDNVEENSLFYNELALNSSV